MAGMIEIGWSHAAMPQGMRYPTEARIAFSHEPTVTSGIVQAPRSSVFVIGTLADANLFTEHAKCPLAHWSGDSIGHGQTFH